MYNGHIHIFNSRCTPDDFLKLGIPGKRLDGFANAIKIFMESKRGRRLLKFVLSNRRIPLVQFLDIGVEASQRKVFERLNAVYSGYSAKYFVLTLNMDYMTNSPSGHASYETQLAEVMQLKQTYPNELLVFLSCDPRHKQGKELRDWFKSYYESGKVVGIKLYPALGYFPFDPRLVELYEYADQYKVPMLTHTTREGAFYIGNNVRTITGTQPDCFDSDQEFNKRVRERIQKFNSSTHKKLQLNDHYCNIFSHPENYLPILKRFKNLKLCFAHYGGTSEILRLTDDFMLATELEQTTNWTDLIREYIRTYDNVYSDISYSLADVETHEEFIRDMEDEKIRKRLFFGTDYFMEERKKPEAQVFADFRTSFLGNPEYYRALTIENPERFIS